MLLAGRGRSKDTHPLSCLSSASFEGDTCSLGGPACAEPCDSYDIVVQ